MFQAASPLPVPSQDESALWELGQEAGLIHELRDTWNVRLWLVRLDAERWRQAMGNCPKLFPDETDSPTEIPKPRVRNDSAGIP